MCDKKPTRQSAPLASPLNTQQQHIQVYNRPPTMNAAWSNRANARGRPVEGFVDCYLSTDDEAEASPHHCRKSSGKAVAEEAQQRAELNRARMLAHQRMDRHEAHERARAFAVLDNVSERESPSCREMKNNSRSPLDPALNPHIDHEAAEVGDSDSDLLHDNDSSLASDSSFFTADTIDDGSSGKEKGKGASREETVASECLDGSDDDKSQDGETFYDDIVASREAIEAQIDAEEKKRKRYQFCDTSSDEEPSLSGNNSDRGSSNSRGSCDIETEEEASFSSVVGRDE